MFPYCCFEEHEYNSAMQCLINSFEEHRSPPLLFQAAQIGTEAVHLYRLLAPCGGEVR
jgi:hypothetical protein